MAQQSWDLLDQRLRSKERIILLGQLFHQFFLFVQLLQVISAHMRKTFSLGFVTMLLISENADRELGSWDMAQLNSARETLVLLRIVVLQTNLQVDGLDKFALLGFLGVSQTLSDTLKESLFGYFACSRHLSSMMVEWKRKLRNQNIPM